MSEPKRYTDLQVWEALYFAGSTNGWIRYEDYARLKADAQLVVKHLDEACADNLRLKADVVELCDALKLASEVGIKVADEVTRLKAEVERLTAEKDQAECDHDNCQKRKVSIDNHRFDLFMENAKLKAEVERLRASSFVTAVPVEQYERVVKAGDAVCESPYLWEDDPAVIAWRAAKEGKPSV